LLFSGNSLAPGDLEDSLLKMDKEGQIQTSIVEGLKTVPILISKGGTIES
jgi:hypothetical protein